MTEETSIRKCFEGVIRRYTGAGGTACNTSTVVLRVPTGWHVTKRTSHAFSSEGSDCVSQAFVPDAKGELTPAIFAEEWERST